MVDYSGNVFRIVRNEKKMTQKQVCNGICELRHYQRIEKNETHASTYIMSRICERLGINIFDYVKYSADENVYHIKTVFDKIFNHLYRFQYHDALELITNDQPLNTSEVINVIQTRDYIKLMASFYTNNQHTVSETDFLELLKLTNEITEINQIFSRPISEIEYRILNSLASYYFETEDFEQGSLLLYTIIDHMEKSQVVEDYHVIYCKACQNLGRVELANHNNEKAFNITKKGMDLSIKKGSLFVFEGLCKVHGQALYRLHGAKKAHDYLIAYVAITRVIKPNIDFKTMIDEITKDYNLDCKCFEEEFFSYR